MLYLFLQIYGYLDLTWSVMPSPDTSNTLSHPCGSQSTVYFCLLYINLCIGRVCLFFQNPCMHFGLEYNVKCWHGHYFMNIILWTSLFTLVPVMDKVWTLRVWAQVLLIKSIWLITNSVLAAWIEEFKTLLTTFILFACIFNITGDSFSNWREAVITSYQNGQKICKYKKLLIVVFSCGERLYCKWKWSFSWKMNKIVNTILISFFFRERKVMLFHFRKLT